MILACVGIYAQNFTSKIAPSHDLITLHGINRNLALFSDSLLAQNFLTRSFRISSS